MYNLFHPMRPTSFIFPLFMLDKFWRTNFIGVSKTSINHNACIGVCVRDFVGVVIMSCSCSYQQTINKIFV